MRIALLEIGHWHCPLYLAALRRPDIQIVAVSDPDPAIRAGPVAEFGCVGYGDYRELLQKAEPDFVFSFGQHDQMPSIAEDLISRGIPFAIEKPCGRSQRDVTRVREAAEKSGLFVAIPYIYRVCKLRAVIENAEGALPTDISHFSVRNIAGPPSRYREIVPWLLNPAISGGGCAMNLGGHFIDFAFLLTGSRAKSVYSQMSSKLHTTPVEDYALIVMTHNNGAISSIEVGYTFPTSTEKREFSLTCSSGKNYFRTTDHGLCALQRNEPGRAVVKDFEIDHDTDSFYREFVTQTLNDVQTGQSPVAGLRDLEAVMGVLDAAYRSAKTGQPVSL